MKKILALFAALILISIHSRAQAPQGINYQGVARNSSGAAMVMTNINIRFTVLQNGGPVYVETHTALTDTFGLYNKVIGQGTPVSGNFISINWGGGNLSIQVEIDDNSGAGYQLVGTSQFESVPYALYANNAGNTAGGTVSSITGGAGVDANPSTITTTGSFSLAPSGVTPATYGNANTYPVITVDAMGRITNAATQTISTGVSTVTTLSPIVNNGTSSAPIIGINQAGTASDGYLSQTDWNAFYGKVSAVGVNSPLSVTGPTSTPTVSIPKANAITSGYLDLNDWNAFNNKVSSITNGTGILSSNIGSSYTLTADAANPIWNANQLQGTPILNVAPLPNDILKFNGTQWTSSPLPPALPPPTVGSILFSNATNNWVGSNPSTLFTDGANIGMGTNSPTANLDIVSTNTLMSVNIMNNATGGGLNIQTSPTANVYALKSLQLGSTQAGYFEINNTSNVNDAVFAQTNGNGNSVKGYTSANGNGVMGWNDNQSGSTGGAGIFGYSTGLGNAGVFQIQNGANANEAIKVSTNGTGYSATFSGGAGVKTDKLQITGPNAPANGYVLTSDNLGNASWQLASGGLPVGTPRSMMYYDPTNVWKASDTAQLATDGMSIKAVNSSTVGTAGIFVTNNPGASNAPALLAVSNSSTGYALRADNLAGAAIVANSSGPYVLSANMSAGGGDAVGGFLLNNSTGGNAVIGSVDGTSFGTSGYFENQNLSNGMPTLKVVNQPASPGRSAIFSGGAGVQIDKLEIQTALHISPGANNGFVLTSNVTGDATWMPPSGVQTVSGTGPITSTGGNNPVVGMSNSGVIAGTYGGASQYPQITIDQYGRVTSAVAFALGGTLNGGTVNYIPKWSGPSALSSTSLLFDNGTAVGVNTATPGAVLDVLSAGTSTSSALRATQVNAGNAVATFTTTNATNNAAAVVIGHAGTGSGLNITTGNGNGINATTSGTTGTAGNFQNTSTGNNNPVVNVSAAGAGPGVNINASGSGSGISSVSTSSVGAAGYFSMNNAANNNYAVGIVSTSTLSSSLYVNNNGGGGGKAADMQILGAASTGDVLWATNNGKGKAGNFAINNAANTNPAINATTNGTGDGIDVTITNTTSTSPAIYSQHSGQGTALTAYSSGTYGVYANNTNATSGSAGGFFNNNGSYALAVQNNGTGGGIGSTVVGSSGTTGYFNINNAANTAPAMIVATNGLGGGISVSTSNATNNANTIAASTSGTGFSGSFSGGKGLQADKLELTGGASANAVLVSSNAAGDAVWAAPVNFAAEKSSTGVANTTATTMAFTSTLYQNPAGSFNGTVFAAPVAGLYHFDAGINMNIVTGLAAASNVVVRIVVNGVSYREAQLHLPASYTGAADNIVSCDAQLPAGATVRVDVFQDTQQSLIPVASPGIQNYFNGHLVR